MPRKFNDVSGQRFGRLVAIKPVLGEKRKKMECLCDCGKTTITDSYKLTSGHTQSCGCYWRERVASANITHGHSTNRNPSPEWTAYNGMNNRCRNKNGINYKDYGGRGIKICDRWMPQEGGVGFINFLSDMGTRPSRFHSLDRIDVNGPYSPENCRWATRKEQGQNTRRNRLITFNGQTLCVSQWANKLGIRASIICARLDQGGWTVDEALSTPRLSGVPRSPGIKPDEQGCVNQEPVIIPGPGSWML